MLDCDLWQILRPVLLESNLFLPFVVIFCHYFGKTLLKALLKSDIIIVARLYYCLVVRRVLYFDLSRDFVLLKIIFVLQGADRSLRVRPFSFILSILVLEASFEVDLENGGSEAGEFARSPSTQICILLNCNQMLYIFVLFLNDFVSRQHNEMIFVD